MTCDTWNLTPEKDHWLTDFINKLINDNHVFRTAPASHGNLMIGYIFLFQAFDYLRKSYIFWSTLFH